MNIDNLLNKTVFELKSYAKTNGIPLGDAKKKVDILSTIEAFTPSNVITENIKEEYEKVALYSKRNIHWSEIGNLKIGYNIVSKDQAKIMSTHKAVRVASPEEVASYYGK